MAGLAISCNKNKNTGPAKEKTPIEYIPQMMGSYKMLGTYRKATTLSTPPTDTTTYIETHFNISRLADSVISIETSDGGKMTCYYKPDTSSEKIGFVVSPASHDIERLTYYYHKDSLVYYAYYNYNILHEIKLHSE